MPSPNNVSVARLGAALQIFSGKSDENLASTYQNRDVTDQMKEIYIKWPKCAIDRTST